MKIKLCSADCVREKWSERAGNETQKELNGPEIVGVEEKTEGIQSIP